VDVLGQRYGWTKKYVEEDLYWEEFIEFVEIAANFIAEEKNHKEHFQFMLHADKQSANKWQDSPIPFPERNKQKDKDFSGISQIPQHLRGAVIREK